MRARSTWLSTLAVAMLLVLAACGRLDIPIGSLLYDVQVTPDNISPNADGESDVTEIQYSLRRAADVSIYFEDEAGERYYFRKDRRRSPGNYSVFWGGTLEQTEEEMDAEQTEYGVNQIVSRVLPDGEYTWHIAAVSESGDSQEASGVITLQDGDVEVPELHNFAVIPDTFRPNQDGLPDDWVSISYYLTKDVESVNVYLSDPAQPGVKLPIAEEPGVAKTTDKGFHEYRYEGGVDLNAEPPDDGTYQIVGEARDRAGNAVRVVRELTIEEGGKPRADIAQGEVDWEGEVNRVVSVPLGQNLCFKAIVTNEGTVPIRTAGPWPGQEYKFSENYNTLAARGHKDWYLQAGVWRFGINFESTGIDFPFRWAVGRPEDLELRVIDGQEQYYLMPGKSGEVSGCILMDEEPPLSTNYWWAGLIHENVEVANNYVDRITVNVGIP
ncbi:MAG: hypothetical protein ACK2UO_05810 [Caldilineaceae bacterium]